MKELIEKLEHGLMVCDVTNTSLVHLDKKDAEKLLELLSKREEYETHIDELVQFAQARERLLNAVINCINEAIRYFTEKLK